MTAQDVAVLRCSTVTALPPAARVGSAATMALTPRMGPGQCRGGSEVATTRRQYDCRRSRHRREAAWSSTAAAGVRSAASRSHRLRAEAGPQRDQAGHQLETAHPSHAAQPRHVRPATARRRRMRRSLIVGRHDGCHHCLSVVWTARVSHGRSPRIRRRRSRTPRKPRGASPDLPKHLARSPALRPSKCSRTSRRSSASSVASAEVSRSRDSHGAGLRVGLVGGRMDGGLVFGVVKFVGTELRVAADER
jgi:hypothetical protein